MVSFDHVILFIIDEKYPYPIEYSYELNFYDPLLEKLPQTL